MQLKVTGCHCRTASSAWQFFTAMKQQQMSKTKTKIMLTLVHNSGCCTILNLHPQVQVSEIDHLII
jgi:hypothetical protein